MAGAGVLSAAASVIPGASTVTGAASVVSSVLALADPGRLRDAARVNRRDFYLNAAKGGSVYGARYLLGGLTEVVAAKERKQYEDGISELSKGSALWQETLYKARNLGALWPTGMSDEDGIRKAGDLIAKELGQALDLPAGIANANQRTAIEAWARQFGYDIRKDAATAVAKLSAGAGTGLANQIAPDGEKNHMLLPTSGGMLALAVLAVLALGYLAMRKR